MPGDSGSKNTRPPVYIVSGGVGASGGELLNTILAQFPDHKNSLITVGNVRQLDQIEAVVASAGESGGLIVHTLVEERLRNALTGLAQDRGVKAIDLMGSLVDLPHQPCASAYLRANRRCRLVWVELTNQ